MFNITTFLNQGPNTPGVTDGPITDQPPIGREIIFSLIKSHCFQKRSLAGFNKNKMSFMTKLHNVIINYLNFSLN